MKLVFRLALINLIWITTYATSMQPQPHWYKKPAPVPRRSPAQVLHQNLQTRLNQVTAFSVTLANDNNCLKRALCKRDAIIYLQQQLIQVYELKNNQNDARSESHSAIILHLKQRLEELQKTP